jgi:hypothetical protein
LTSSGGYCSVSSRSPLFGFHLPPEYFPAEPSRSAAALRLLSWASAPFSTNQVSRSTLRGFNLPATFRLQGLATLLAAYSLETLAGSFSHQPRSWDLPFGAFSSQKASGVLPHGRTHLPFSLLLITPPKRRAGATGRGSWAHTFRESLAAADGFSIATAGCSLGFYPSKALPQRS